MQGSSLAEEQNDEEMTQEVPDSRDNQHGNPPHLDPDDLPNYVADSTSQIPGLPGVADFSENNSYMNDQDLQNEWLNQWHQQHQQQQQQDENLGQNDSDPDWLTGYGQTNQQNNDQGFW